MSDHGTPTKTPYDVPSPRTSGRLLRLGGALLAAGRVLIITSLEPLANGPAWRSLSSY